MITASLPTPLGPLMTMTSGFEGGTRGSVLNDEPNVASRPLNNSSYHRDPNILTSLTINAKMKYRKVQFKSSDKKILAIHPYDGYLLELIDYDYLTNS